MHSAGHLIAHLIERDFPFLRVVDGHHFPGEGRIRFEGEIPADTPLPFIEKKLQQSLVEAIHDKLLITSTHNQEGIRIVQIGTFSAVPCGGTHIKTLEELDEVTVRYVKVDKQKISVGYEL
jgi:Ser-tRNA(Ala) deacylase AlaX